MHLGLVKTNLTTSVEALRSGVTVMRAFQSYTYLADVVC